jgi:predicted DNA-binding ribbon-helix-helix protein
MKTTVFKRSVIIHGHKTSVSLESEFWHCVRQIAAREGTTISDLVSGIDRTRGDSNLSSAIRLFVLQDFQSRADPSLRSQSAGDKPGRRPPSR